MNPWALMTVLFVALLAVAKWLTLWHARGARPVGPWRSAVYFVAWPGMDAPVFLEGVEGCVRPRGSEWAAATAKIILGATVVWGVVPRVHGLEPRWSAALGFAGLVLLFHMGALHLVALAWRSTGTGARPIMKSPLLATSLPDFWGARWNLAFRDFAHALVLRPLIPRIGVVGATMAVFAMSGLLHDVLISIPAGGGYGRPTAYFLLQGAGVVLTRTRTGRRLGLARGWRGRAMAIGFTVVPLGWLFHGPFLERVVIPLMQVIGSGGAT